MEQVAVIKCRGDCSFTSDKMDYYGMQSCAAAKLLYGGTGKCTFGCIGLGDCANVCPNGAICLENGIAHVDTRRCTGCGMCTKTCPNHLISLMSDTEKMLVTCSNTEKGAITRQKCSHGCIGCQKCAKTCQQEAIIIEKNLARIDYEKCIDCGDCARACPTGAIMHEDFSGIHRVQAEAEK